MIEKREAPSRELLIELWQKSEKIDRVRKELKTSWTQARKWLMEAGITDTYNNSIPQTPNPEPAKVDRQEPDQGKKESAQVIIPVAMPFGCELPKGEEYQGLNGATATSREIEKPYTPEDHGFTEEITLTDYLAAEPEIKCERRKEPRPDWLNRHTVEALQERWVCETMRQSLPKELKLELIAKLLDIEVA